MTDISHFSDLFQSLSSQIEQISRAVDELSFKSGAELDDKSCRGKPRSGNRKTSPSEVSTRLSLLNVRQLIHARQLRDKYFPSDLFADPAWEIIMCLMEARLARSKVTITKLCKLTSVPYTTSLRWVGHLTEIGIIEKSDDATDGRRVFLRLSDKGVASFQNWYIHSSGSQ